IAIEALTPGGMPARVVNLFIADSSGVASAALGRKVAAALLDFRAAGIAVVISLSIPQIVDVLLHLMFQAGVDSAALVETVRAAIVEYVNSLPVSAPLTRAALLSLLQRFAADGLIVNEASVVA